MTTLPAALLCLLLAACGSETTEKKEEGVFDPLVQNLDKAKEVEDKVLQQKEELDKAIKKAEEAVDEVKAEVDEAVKD